MRWPFDPTVYAGLLLFAVGRWWLGRLEGDRPGRRAYFAAGLLVVWVALESPLDPVGDHYLQSAHMLQHVLIAIVAPPLLLLGLTPAQAARIARTVPGLTRAAAPIPAQVGFAVVMTAWHLPRLYDLTLASEPVHIVEHLSLMAGGTLYFWPVVAATAATLERRLGEVERIVYLLIGTVPQDTIGLVLLFVREPLYYPYLFAPRLAPGLDPLTDQVLAGVVLEAMGKISYLVAMVAIFFTLAARARGEEAAQG